MLRYTCRFLLTILCFAVFNVATATEPFVFSNLSLKDGLSQITVLSIHQDKKGYMWFGTRKGLNRYDGYNFIHYQHNAEDTTSISDNHILCIAEDDKSNLWIGTNNGLNRLDVSTGKFKRYFFSTWQSSLLGYNMVYSLCYDKEGNLWAGTKNGLSRYDADSDSFIRVDVGGLLIDNTVNRILRYGDKLYLGTSLDGLIVYDIYLREHQEYFSTSDNPEGIPYSYVRSILMDKQETLWVGTYDGGVWYRKKGEKNFNVLNTQNGLTDNNVRTIAEAPDGSIIVGTFNGLSIVNPFTFEVEQYVKYGAQEGFLSHNSVFTVYFDRIGTMWVGTYAGGVDYASKYEQQFRYYNPTLISENFFGILGAILETEDYIYIASEGMGLLEWDKQNNSFKTYSTIENGRSKAPRIVKSLCRSGDKLLCGTNVGTIYEFNIKTKKFRLVRSLSETNPIYHLGVNHKGEETIGTVTDPVGFLIGGVEQFKLKDGTRHSFGNVRCVLEITKDRYLIGTRNDGLYDYNRQKGELKQYKVENVAEIGENIPNNYVSVIHKDDKNRIWIGTFGGGFTLFNSDTGEFTLFTSKDGLLSDNVCSIVDDVNGHLWISTISGISDFDPDAGEFVNYTIGSGIGVNEFTPNAGKRLSNGRIVFSGNNGFVTFDPSDMFINPYIPPIELQSLHINNDLVEPGMPDGILDKELGYQKKIVLKHNQSNFSIEYSALNYIYPERNQYKYILEGFDTDWNNVAGRRMAYYTNIPPGKYKFIVKGSNNDGHWNEEGASVDIVILPPFWKTIWAYSIYFIFFVGMAMLVLRYLNERKRLQDSINIKQAEAKAQAEFHEERTRLFTNFSHELRTPLSLIMSPLDDVLECDNTLSSKTRKSLNLMQSNARRLLRLVNNLMDFQKRESGMLLLNISSGEFVSFVEEMVDSFRELAQSRDILLELNTDVKSIPWWFDYNLMEKVFFNFLSNAFKNVPNGGNIEVSISLKRYEQLQGVVDAKRNCFSNREISYILLEIKDSGKGIPEEELENIFIPFYQVAQNEHSSSGTGLGLSLSKAIIELHHGIVWAESPQETGAIFRTLIPIDNSLYGLTETPPDYIDSDSVHFEVEIPEVSQIKPSLETVSEDKKHTILVVEDNSDVRNYIVSHLSVLYNVLEAANGEEACDIALSYFPDLIVSDLMMPKMDGLEMVKILKEDLRTSHIPIVMITAKAMSSDIREGYEVGADDYIVKPFNSSVLMARIGNLIQSRESLKALYGKRFDLDTLGVEVTSLDERFMNKVYDILEQNLSNSQFSIDDFSKEVGMSRASLYRKMKAVTDLSPNEFVRNFRLEIAANMLKESPLSVSEVYVAVGFNSHAYFSNCFKTIYNLSPSEYSAQYHPEQKQQ